MRFAGVPRRQIFYQRMQARGAYPPPRKRLEASVRQARPSEKTMALIDASRAAAAVYVVLYHVGVERGWTDGPGMLLRFGQEAVMVFFLLSGFVIFLNEKDRSSQAGYFFRRLRRIYPALVVALLVSAVVAFVDGRLAAEFRLSELVGTLFAMQDIAALKPGVIVDPFLGNAALWTLSYEIVFYLLFPLTMLAWRRRPGLTTHAVGAASCLAYLLFSWAPGHWVLILSYYSVWWAGAMAADAYMNGRRNAAALAAPIGWLFLLCCTAAGVVFTEGYAGPGVYPFLQLRHFLVALLVVAFGFGPLGAWLAALALPFKTPAGAVASISYGLYVLHFPLLIQSSLAASAAGLAAMSGILLVLSYGADRSLNAHLPRWKSRPAREPAAMVGQQS